jgi:uncharacterized protein YjbI with pentapeptide repeats
LPKRHARRLDFADPNEKARADAEDDFRRTISQIFGGAAVLIGAGFAYLQFTEQQRAAHDLLISNQVAKGFELLGNKDDKIHQRLGGIYALEGVMNTSEEYHQPVLEALSAFVRDGTRSDTGDGPPATDIQAALTVVGRRTTIGTGIPDLAEAHIQKANLSGANLGGANLFSANLGLANLSGDNLFRANLSGANLNHANLSGDNLSTADLSGAILFSANLSGAILAGANLSGDLSGANLSGAIISQAELDQACGTDVKLDPGLTIKPCQK